MNRAIVPSLPSHPVKRHELTAQHGGTLDTWTRLHISHLILHPREMTPSLPGWQNVRKTAHHLRPTSC